MDFDKFIYKKMQFETDSNVRHFWYLINKQTKQGVHFHGVKDKKGSMLNFDNNVYHFHAMGIERHKTTPDYDGQKPVPNCDVTGGYCYCDGTSLGASESLGHINPDGSDDGIIWMTLEDYYESWIGD